MKNTLLMLLFLLVTNSIFGQAVQNYARKEVVKPLHKDRFSDGKCDKLTAVGAPKTGKGYQVFMGQTNSDNQMDPQIAVGNDYVVHGTNNGLMIFNKNGKYVDGVSQTCFNDGIDPKMFYDIHNKIFVFDLFWYYDKPKKKPVNISVSETADPTGAWNTYPVSASKADDGGAIGYSRKWIGYSFPGGEENTLVMLTDELKTGKPATVYHFKGSLGEPVFTQDATDDLYFFQIDDTDFTIKKITQGKDGAPYCELVTKTPHRLQYVDYPPEATQKGSKATFSSGDRNPKNVVLQDGSIWFSQAVNVSGRSAIQWHQIDVKRGKSIQTGLIKSDTSHYIQTTIAVNTRNDVLIGFQEVNEKMYVSPRFVYRNSKEALGTVSPIMRVAEGKAPVKGGAWGDYSGSVLDGDNLMDLWTVQSVANKKGTADAVIVKVPAAVGKKIVCLR